MNNYQHKRVLGCLKRADKLNVGEKKFLERLLESYKVAHWGKRDGGRLSADENTELNLLARRVGG